MSSSRLHYGRNTWTRNTAPSASTRSGGRRVAPGRQSAWRGRLPLSRNMGCDRYARPARQASGDRGASDPRARLADMDAMGVGGLFLVRDPDVAYALARSCRCCDAGSLGGGSRACAEPYFALLRTPEIATIAPQSPGNSRVPATAFVWIHRPSGRSSMAYETISVAPIAGRSAPR